MVGKKKADKLPNKLIHIPNEDKGFTEHWYKNRSALNFPAPHRVILCGKPGCSKTNTLKNIIMRQHPPYDRIYLIHCDSENTREYDDFEPEILDGIPDPNFWSDPEEKKAVILDDIEYQKMPKDQLRNLSRLVGYCSTHRNVNVFITSQDAMTIAPIVRRCANVFILWKNQDLDSMVTLARKSGLKKDDLKDIFKSTCQGDRDGLWIDLTPGTPYPLRVNGFEILTKNDDEGEIISP